MEKEDTNKTNVNSYNHCKRQNKSRAMWESTWRSAISKPGTTNGKAFLRASSSSVSCSTESDSATPWHAARQAPLSVGFSRQEYWSALPSYSSRGPSTPRDGTLVSWIADRLLSELLRAGIWVKWLDGKEPTTYRNESKAMMAEKMHRNFLN